MFSMLLSPAVLWYEYELYNPKSSLRFGEMIWKQYGVPGQDDKGIFYERNNGVAYKMILAEITKNRS